MKEINLNHICKIEGHAHLSLKLDNGRVVECHLKAAEGARFFEALVMGRKVESIQEIVSRICGICSSAHSVCAVEALENALGIKASDGQKNLRELLMMAERIRSHATHLYFMALPDYFGYESALQMTQKYKKEIDNAIAIIKLGNRIVDLFGGREIHPFLHIKEHIKEHDYNLILGELESAKPIITRTINLFFGLKYPRMARDCDYMCLKSRNRDSISGKLVSHSGFIEVENYKEHLKENIKEYATSNFVLKDGKPYQLGAIARLNNNKKSFDEESQEYIKKLNKKYGFPLKNPFLNNIAQAIELLAALNNAIKDVKELRKISEKEEKLSYKIREGSGVGAVEAPRGTLFHEYRINKQGIIEYCNIIPPTTQNLNMMEIDITNLVNELLEKKANKARIIGEVEKLIRAYDPCFSCSTHFLEVEWLGN